MDASASYGVIHPEMLIAFPDPERCGRLIPAMRGSTRGRLAGLIKWHMDANRDVMDGIRETYGVDLAGGGRTEWARRFLAGYDSRIRGLRQASDRTFDRFQALRDDLGRITRDEGAGSEVVRDMMGAFVNREGPLIGRIIFAYRELWFLARHIMDPRFDTGSISGYVMWRDRNLPRMENLDRSLAAAYQACRTEAYDTG